VPVSGKSTEMGVELRYTARLVEFADCIQKLRREGVLLAEPNPTGDGYNRCRYGVNIFPGTESILNFFISECKDLAVF
jgi:hypothetical protein